jgi:hypothetical protein
MQVKVLRYDATDTEVKIPAKFKVVVLNEGNIDAVLRLNVEIVKDGAVIDTISRNETVPVGEIDEIKVSWDTSGKPVGKYTAVFHLSVGEKEVLVAEKEFNVYERGTLTAKIDVLEAKTKSVIDPGTSKIDATIRNSGLIDYETRLRVEIFRGNDFLTVVESNPMWVGTGERQTLTAYFSIDEPGTYILKPSIYFGGKVVILNDTIVTVTAASVGEDSNAVGKGSSTTGTNIPASSLSAFVIISLILALFVWIRQKK